MKCTSCGAGTLNPSYLEGLLPCHTCSNCGGNLLMLSDYLRWLDQNPDAVLAAEPASKVEPSESSKALTCPKTGRLMTKYKISSDSDHRLDLSPSINAIWLDRGEWKLIKEKGLAGRLNAIFTHHWQQEIKSQASADVMAVLYQRRFGDDYKIIKEFREKLHSLETKSEALAYLMAEDPYAP